MARLAQASRQIGPYLVALDGRPYSYGGKTYKDAVIDPYGRAVCQTCIAGILPGDWTSGPALPHHPRCVIDGVPQAPFVWWFTEKLRPAVRRAFYAYLTDPKCSPKTHAWLEDASLALALEKRDEAAKALFELRGRPKGWSIGQKASDTPAPVCAWCARVLNDQRCTIAAPGSAVVSLCVRCWSEVAPEFVEIIKHKKKEAAL